MFGSNHKSILEPQLGPGFLFCPSCKSTIDSQLGPDILFPVDSRTSTYNSGQSFLSQLQVYRQLATGSNLFCPSCKSIIDSQLRYNTFFPNCNAFSHCVLCPPVSYHATVGIFFLLKQGTLGGCPDSYLFSCLLIGSSLFPFLLYDPLRSLFSLFYFFFVSNYEVFYIHDFLSFIYFCFLFSLFFFEFIIFYSAICSL